MTKRAPQILGALVLFSCLAAGCSSSHAPKAAGVSGTSSGNSGDDVGNSGDTTSTDAVDPTPANAPTTTPTTALPTTSTIPNPGLTTITVTGTGPASTVTVDLGGQETQHTQLALPWSTQVPEDFSGTIVMNAQDGSGAANATITCAISDSFGTLDTNTSTGPYTVVSCQNLG